MIITLNHIMSKFIEDDSEDNNMYDNLGHDFYK